MKKIVMAAALLLSFGAGLAQAGPYTTPTSNDVIGEKDGWLGVNLYLVGGPATILVEYVGKEAGYQNTFFFNDTLLFNTNSGSNPSQSFNAVASGLLPFKFVVNGGPSVANGSNTLPPATPNFFVSLGNGPGFMGDPKGGANPGSGTVAILALDDGGAGPDDNHDDMVVRLSITGATFSVPDGGATLALLGGALMGIGLFRRKLSM